MVEVTANFPVPWRRLRVLLRDVHRRAGKHGARARALSARALVLLFPDWAAELVEARVPREELRIIQARVLAAGLAHDDCLDAKGDGLRSAPLLCEAQRRLSRLFEAAHPFWRQWDRLLREQTASARWELSARPRRFDAALVRALGRKAALLRWPAHAVAHLSGRPGQARRLDQIFERFLCVLQLFDDLADVDEDARAGQINSALVARRAAGTPLADVLVHATARDELVRLRRRAHGSFAALCADLAQPKRGITLISLRLSGPPGLTRVFSPVL